MVIIGLDIETTGGSHHICEFAAVALEVKSGKEIFKTVSLINPGLVDWNYFAMRVHGISPSMVRGKPGLLDVWTEFKRKLAPYATTARCFAHNASFERTHLGNGLGRKFDVSLECTIALAKPQIPASNYKLPTVCAAMGIPFSETHRAEPDARAAAQVAQQLVAGYSSGGVRVQKSAVSVPTRSAKRPVLAVGNAERGINSVIIASTKQVGRCFAGKKVCITGAFSNGITKEAGKRLVAAHGGIPVDNVANSTDIVVIAASGAKITRNDLTTAKAQKAVACGIELMSGLVFLKLTN